MNKETLNKANKLSSLIQRLEYSIKNICEALTNGCLDEKPKQDNGDQLPPDFYIRIFLGNNNHQTLTPTGNERKYLEFILEDMKQIKSNLEKQLTNL